MPKKKLILISIFVISILIIGSIFYIFSRNKKETLSPPVSVDEEMISEQWKSEDQLSEMKKIEEEVGQELTESQAEKQLKELDNLGRKNLPQEQAEKQLDEMRKVQQTSPQF